MNKQGLAQRKLRSVLAAVLVLLVVTVAWRGTLDAQSSDYVESAMLGAGALYGTARGINIATIIAVIMAIFKLRPSRGLHHAPIPAIIAVIGS